MYLYLQCKQQLEAQNLKQMSLKLNKRECIAINIKRANAN